MTKKDEIIEEIRKIYDPELPVNIYELGLIYDIKVKDEKFAIIKMTLTTPNCPVAESLPKEVKEGAFDIDIAYTHSLKKELDGMGEKNSVFL